MVDVIFLQTVKLLVKLVSNTFIMMHQDKILSFLFDASNFLMKKGYLNYPQRNSTADNSIGDYAVVLQYL